jgi:hypothetical protein
LKDEKSLKEVEETLTFLCSIEQFGYINEERKVEIKDKKRHILLENKK